jgi:hypothetical protein
MDKLFFASNYAASSMVKIAGVLQKTMIDCRTGTVPGRQRDAFCPSSKTGCWGIGEPDSRVGPPTRGFYTRSRNFATIRLIFVRYPCPLLLPPTNAISNLTGIDSEFQKNQKRVITLIMKHLLNLFSIPDSESIYFPSLKQKVLAKRCRIPGLAMCKGGD